MSGGKEKPTTLAYASKLIVQTLTHYNGEALGTDYLWRELRSHAYVSRSTVERALINLVKADKVKRVGQHDRGGAPYFGYLIYDETKPKKTYTYTPPMTDIDLHAYKRQTEGLGDEW